MDDPREAEILEMARLRGNIGFTALIERALKEQIRIAEADLEAYPPTPRQREEVLPYWQALKRVQKQMQELLDSCEKRVRDARESNPLYGKI